MLTGSSLQVGNGSSISSFASGIYSVTANGLVTCYYGITFASTPQVITSLGYKSAYNNACLFTGTITSTYFQYTILTTTGANQESQWNVRWIAIL